MHPIKRITAASTRSELNGLRSRAPGRASTTGSGLIRKDGLVVGTTAHEPDVQRELPPEHAAKALLASARHELRSPLQSIQGFAELLAAESYGTLGTDQRVFVDHIMQSSLDLSRVLDACFELVQAELSPLAPELGPVLFRRAFTDAFTLARSNADLTVDARFEALAPELTITTDSFHLAKAVSAIATALQSTTHGPLAVVGSLRSHEVEVLFGPQHDEPPVFRGVEELSGRGCSARSLLFLRLASALMKKAGAQLGASEDLALVRVSIPVDSGA